MGQTRCGLGPVPVQEGPHQGQDSGEEPQRPAAPRRLGEQLRKTAWPLFEAAAATIRAYLALQIKASELGLLP